MHLRPALRSLFQERAPAAARRAAGGSRGPRSAARPPPARAAAAPPAGCSSGTAPAMCSPLSRRPAAILRLDEAAAAVQRRRCIHLYQRAHMAVAHIDANLCHALRQAVYISTRMDHAQQQKLACPPLTSTITPQHHTCTTPAPTPGAHPEVCVYHKVQAQEFKAVCVATGIEAPVRRAECSTSGIPHFGHQVSLQVNLQRVHKYSIRSA